MCEPIDKVILDKRFQEPVIEVDLSQVMRCPFCRKPVLKGKIESGSAFETRCSKCKKFFKIKVL